MEREELRTRINEVLGSTKLTLSERTINDFLDDALAGITDDNAVTEEFVTRKANMLKSIDGNLHSDVSEQVKKYKEGLTKQEPDPKPDPTPDPEPKPLDNGMSDEIEALKKRLKSFEDERKKAIEEKKREAELKELKEAFEAHFEEAGVSVNGYVLKQTLRDFKRGKDMAEDVKALESKYYDGLKEAGFDYGSPMSGGISANPSGVQSRRDALKEELRSRGMLPKQKQE